MEEIKDAFFVQFSDSDPVAIQAAWEDLKPYAQQSLHRHRASKTPEQHVRYAIFLNTSSQTRRESPTHLE